MQARAYPYCRSVAAAVNHRAVRVSQFQLDEASIALGKQGRLGWTTWLRGQPMERDADQLVLDPLRAAG